MSKEEKNVEFMLQMKHDLDLAKQITANPKGQEQSIESLVLSGIIFGRYLEREKIQHHINQSEIDYMNTEIKDIINSIKK